MTDAATASASPVAVILPAHDEASYLPACLDALFASDVVGLGPKLIIVANGCGDDTAHVARSYARAAQAAGWALTVIETQDGGKLNALNLGDAETDAKVRIYLDADVVVSPGLVRALTQALDRAVPRYASGRPRLAPARSLASRAFGRYWMTLPFNTEGVPGYGLYAMNAAGRARWNAWPAIISDDGFARLHFALEEQVAVGADYRWPLVEGFANLVRVRRRQNAGIDELRTKFPALGVNDSVPPPGLGGILARALRHPLGFFVYAGVALAVKTPLFGSSARWARGR